jgi:hypothetical protein
LWHERQFNKNIQVFFTPPTKTKLSSSIAVILNSQKASKRMSILFLEDATQSFCNNMNFPSNDVHDALEMDRLVQILSDAEHIVEGQQQEQTSDASVSLSMFEPINLSALATPFPCMHSSACFSTALSCIPNLMDLLEPTPIGGSIRVVDKIAPSPFLTGSVICTSNTTARRVSNNSVAPMLSASTDQPSHIGSAIMVDIPSSPRTVISSSSEEAFSPTKTSKNISKKYQDDQWNQRFQELLKFRSQHGHLLVPHGYSKNYKLSQWVKR